jgi:hypothetical protein
VDSKHGSAVLSPSRGSGARWITDQLPDSEITVLVRCEGDEFPVWPCFHDGERWRLANGEALDEPVLGWLDLEDVAKILDGLLPPNAGDKEP